MTEIKRYKPVGGIKSCELFTLQALVSAEDMVAGQGVMVSLSDDGSRYEERMSCEHGPVSVEHTLTLCSERSEAARWFEHELLQRMAIEGVAALITLASGESLRLGWSPRFGFEQPLRLLSLSFSSGDKPNNSPRVELKLQSHDTDSAIT